MRRLILLPFILGAFTTLHAEPGAGGKGSDTNAIVLSIRQEFNSINEAVSTYKKVEKDLTQEGASSEGGALYKYYDRHKKLRKMVCVFYGETGKTVEEYYVRNDRLLFVYKKNEYYKVPITVDQKIEVVRVEEERNYFDDGHLVKWLKDKKAPAQEEWPKEETKLLDAYRIYLKS